MFWPSKPRSDLPSGWLCLQRFSTFRCSMSVACVSGPSEAFPRLGLGVFGLRWAGACQGGEVRKLSDTLGLLETQSLLEAAKAISASSLRCSLSKVAGCSIEHVACNEEGICQVVGLLSAAFDSGQRRLNSCNGESEVS